MNDGMNPGTQAVGAGLREMRERLGWKLPEIAQSLRIRPEFLEAIEAGNLAALPGIAYRSGFVRSYARALGLDPEEILRRFRAAGDLPETVQTETRFIAPVPDSGVPRGAVVLVGALLLLGGYGLWYHYSATQRRLAEQVPAVPAQLAPLATPPKVSPVIPAPATSAAKPQAPASSAAAATPSAAASAIPPAGAQAGSTAASTSTAAPAPGTASPAAAPADGVPAPAVPAGSPAPSVPTPGAGMVIKATQDAWIEVRDPAGNILFSKVLHPGESWPVPQESGLTLTTGNAGGTVIVTNGNAGPPLGAPSAVLRHYQLTPPAPAKPTAPRAGSTPSASAP